MVERNQFADAGDVVDVAAARWADTPIKGKRAILDALLVVTILPVGRGSRVFDPASVRVERRR